MVDLDSLNYPGAAVMSDGGGPYVPTTTNNPNQPQIKAVINRNTGDLLFGLASSGRFLQMNLSSAAYITPQFPLGCNVVSQNPAYPSIPAAWFSTRPGLNVNGVLFVPQDGQPHPTGAIFSGTPYGQVRLTNRVNPQFDFCEGKVLVTRRNTTPASWVIDLPPADSVPYANGIGAVLQDFSTRNNQLDWRAVAYVNPPFRMLVTSLE
jgi:hypothetical protein